MRKLLIASQKSGVGTTTTAINLAVGTARAGAPVLLVDADPVGSISAALDVAKRGRRRELRDMGLDLPGGLWSDVVPGLDVLCPYDEGLSGNGDLEALLRGLEKGPVRYRCVLIDSSPFMSQRPRHLLRHCDELLLVLRAEPVAFRTLPLFFELVKTIKQEDGGVALRGILLTQPADGRWETDLRRYLGSRALPQTIPSDPEVESATSQGQALTLGNASAPAAVQYLELVNYLELQAEAPVLAGKASGREPEAAPAVSPRPVGRAAAAEARRRARSEASLKCARPPSAPSAAPAARKAVVGPVKRAGSPHGPIRPWHMWIGAGMLSGTVLGSVRSPEQFLPAAVGIATTAGVVLAMKLLGGEPPHHNKSA